MSADFGQAAGTGPVFVVLAAPAGRQPVFQSVAQDPPLPTGLQTSKALWISAPTYSGPVLVRGRDLTGGASVLFLRAGSLLTEMQLPPGPSQNLSANGWRNWPTQLAVSDSGCYRLQIDTNDASEHIDFAVTFH